MRRERRGFRGLEADGQVVGLHVERADLRKSAGVRERDERERGGRGECEEREVEECDGVRREKRGRGREQRGRGEGEKRE